MNNSKSIISEGINISNDIYKFLKNLKENSNSISLKSEKEKGQMELGLIENILKVIKLKKNSNDNSGLIYIPSRRLEQSISEKLNSTSVSTSMINNKTSIDINKNIDKVKESIIKEDNFINKDKHNEFSIIKEDILMNKKNKLDNNESEIECFDILNITSIEKNDCNDSLIECNFLNNIENNSKGNFRKTNSNMNIESNNLDQTFSTINFDLESKFNDNCSFISRETTFKMFKSKTLNNLKDIKHSGLYTKMTIYNNNSFNNLNNSKDTIDSKGNFFII